MRVYLAFFGWVGIWLDSNNIIYITIILVVRSRR